ncbi:MAG: hypothetical protein ACK4SU_03950 [Dictyoglomus sp.]
MSLTERRRQFLEGLKELYEKYNRPIHYVELAKKLSVSPATAYDILQNLFKEGYVDVVFLQNSVKNKKGRGKVFFKPKEELIETINTDIPLKLQEFNKYSYPILVILSLVFLLLKDLRPSKELRSTMSLISNIFQGNIEILLIILPLLVIGYAGKKLYEIIPQNRIKNYIEEYIRSLNQLAVEERKVLVKLLLKVLEV